MDLTSEVKAFYQRFGVPEKYFKPETSLNFSLEWFEPAVYSQYKSFIKLLYSTLDFSVKNRYDFGWLAKKHTVC